MSFATFCDIQLKQFLMKCSRIHYVTEFVDYTFDATSAKGQWIKTGDILLYVIIFA